MDQTLSNPLVDLHQRKKQQKRHQFQQQQQFLYQPTSGFFHHDEASPPLPSLSHLMQYNNSNRHPMSMNIVNNAHMKQHLETSSTSNKASYTNMNSLPIPTQMYPASIVAQQQQQRPLMQTETSNVMDTNSLTFDQRSIVDIYQQPLPAPSSFYSNIDQDGLARMDPSTATETIPHAPAVDDQQKIYSFVPLDVILQQKRPRKKFNQVERLYTCTFLNCTKSYGTLNHLNAHVTMQVHGPKRMPIEFKELRRQLKNNRKKLQPPKPRKSSTISQKQQTQTETDLMVNEQDDIRLQQHPPPAPPPPPPPLDFYMRESPLMMTELPEQTFDLYPPSARSSSISSASFTPQQHSNTATSFPTRYNMMQPQQHQQLY